MSVDDEGRPVNIGDLREQTLRALDNIETSWRHEVAWIVVAGTTVAVSLGASIGASVWQDILGVPWYWIVLAVAVISWLAVRSDYHLLLISRCHEEIDPGLHTGIIRAMASSGAAVAAASLVFAATTASFLFSDLRVLGQIGTSTSVGLHFDTLIVPALMTPAMTTVPGRWFRWSKFLRPRPARTTMRSQGIRPAVRQLLFRDNCETTA